MTRTLSLVAFSTLLLATAVEPHAGSARDGDGYRGATDQPSAIASRLLVLTEETSLRGDNCGVDGYPWLSADGQPVEG